MIILGIILIFVCFGCIALLIVIGGSKVKSKREQTQEDEEQMNFINQYKIKKK